MWRSGGSGGRAKGGERGLPYKLVQEAARNAAIRIDAAVAQERPVLAGDFYFGHIEVGVEDLFLVVAGLGENAAEGVGDEAATPEFEA